VYNSPTLPEIKAFAAQQAETLWDEVTRLENPHTYYVDLSKKLWNVRDKLLNISG
jgi:nicotinate phosphoribosyltransferase